MDDPALHVALIADPMIPVPPLHYGGIERIIDMLARGLVDRGHKVTLFAHPDSRTAGKLLSYRGKRPGHPLDLTLNTALISRLTVNRPDVVHSFGRLATIAPLLPMSVPKIMSYQREPSLSRVRMALRWARRGTMAFSGCSDHIAAAMRPVGPSYVIFNGVPLKSYEFVGDVPEEAPLVFLGRIEAIKGTHTAVDIAERAGRQLVIAGNISDQDYFETWIRPRLSDRIRYIGPVDDVRKNALLGSALAFLMPIEWEEPFGIVMAEALACGTPVIGTPRGAVPEVVRDGVTGFVRSDVAGIAEAVELARSIDRRACRADCEARFSDTAIVEQYLALYRDRIAAARNARRA